MTTTMKTIKQLIQQEEAANAKQDNKLRCFAINNFGGGQHAYADDDSLPYFDADYVKACLRTCAGSTFVLDQVRQRAKELAQ